jgi:hypothetical protein
MSAQVENTHIVHPLCVYMKHKGWHTEKTHGSMFQSGFPDLYAMHPTHGQRWIECKVLRNNNIHFEQTQIVKFPIWISHGVKIWIIYGEDFRSVAGASALHSAYMTLFKEANAPYLLNPEYRRIVLG